MDRDDDMESILMDLEKDSTFSVRESKGKKSSFMENFSKRSSYVSNSPTSKKLKPTVLEMSFDKNDFVNFIGLKASYIPYAEFQKVLTGRKLVKLSSLNLNDIVTNRFLEDTYARSVFVGVLGMKLQSQEKNVLMWKLSDLDKTSLGLFAKDLSILKQIDTIRIGSVVMIVDPKFVISETKGGFGIVISTAKQVLNIGQSVEIGMCSNLSKENKKCPNVINKTKDTLCGYHRVKKLQTETSRRMVFSSGSFAPKGVESKELKNAIINFTVGKFTMGSISITTNSYKADIIAKKIVANTVLNPPSDMIYNSRAGSKNLRKLLGVEDIGEKPEEKLIKSKQSLQKGEKVILHPNSSLLESKQPRDHVVEIDIEDGNDQTFKLYGQSKILVKKPESQIKTKVQYRCLECRAMTDTVCGIVGHHIIIVNK